MKKIISLLCIILFFNIELIAMEKRPYHHLPDGTFRNPEGSPVRSKDVKFSYRTFTKEKKKIDITVPKDHVIDKKIVKENLEKFKDEARESWKNFDKLNTLKEPSIDEFINSYNSKL